MSIEIYKKHLNDLKIKNSKSPEWNKIFPEIGKKVFLESIPELLKYKIMICLGGFEYIDNADGYQFATNKEYMKNYVKYYNGFVSELNNVKIRFMFA